MKPITRKEKILDAILSGNTDNIPTPITREETYLKLIAENGSGGGGGESTIAWKPTVDANGNISWTRTSSTTVPATQNIKGNKGNTGDKGDKGETGDNGVSVSSLAINANDHLIVTLSDGTEIDAGILPATSLTAGENVTIENNEISATDTTYENATTTESGLMSAADKTKIDGVESGAQANVKADWSESDNTSDAFIQNKPTIPSALADLTADATHRTVTDTEKTEWSGKSDFSGSYNDLTDKPTIPDSLDDLTDDSTHRLVTDAEKTAWNGKQDKFVRLVEDSFDNAFPSTNIPGQYLYTVLNSATNSPGLGPNYVVIAIVFSETLGKQIAFQNTSNNVYHRYYNNGTWGTWQREIVGSVDTTPTSGSTNLVTSGGVKAALDNKVDFYKPDPVNITSFVSNLPQAVAEQNLEKYGYKLGDFFDGASGYQYTLGDLNTFYGARNQYAVVNTKHIALIVQTGLRQAWNASGSTAGGYVGSDLHAKLSGDVLDSIKSDMTALFGDWNQHLLAHQKLYSSDIDTNAKSSGYGGLSGAASNRDWSTNQYISALTEQQLGCATWTSSGFDIGEAYKKLEVFNRYSPNLIFTKDPYPWLRNIAAASSACSLSHYGYAGYGGVMNASYVSGLILFK